MSRASAERACPRCGNAADPTHLLAPCPGADDTPQLWPGGEVPAALAGAADLPAGTLVGEYAIEAVIGAGGMGTVYRAVQPLIGKRVAVKVLKGPTGDGQASVQRFILEARAVNEIRHRNLVDIFSFGQLTDGRYYYVMEYLEGESLRAVLDDRQRLPPAEALPIFIEVARALEAAHGKSIIHRDLKPDNVFLARRPGDLEPEVKLLDFGLAKLIEGRTDPAGPRTTRGMTLGTPHYMSPEQCRGRPVDGRTDVYAFGVMLYETLTGAVPIDAANPLGIFWAQVYQTPQRAIERAPDIVTPALDELIMKMLAKSADDRPRTATELRQALEAAATAPAAPAGPVSSGTSMIARALESELCLPVAEPARAAPDAQQASALVVRLGSPMPPVPAARRPAALVPRPRAAVAKRPSAPGALAPLRRHLPLLVGIALAAAALVTVLAR